MSDEKRLLEYMQLSDKFDDITCELMLMRIVMLGTLEVFEHNCLPVLGRIPEEYSDEKHVFTALSTALYYMNDKLDELCLTATA